MTLGVCHCQGGLGQGGESRGAMDDSEFREAVSEFTAKGRGPVLARGYDKT